MNPDEIAKYGTEVGKIAATLGFTDAIRRMLGPAIDEVGETLRDRVKLYRYERQMKLLDKFDRIAKEAGFTPQPVSPKILFPLLEGASFEEDEGLHDMWSNLLANAASPDNAAKVRPGFIAILKQMAPDEAGVLKWIYDKLLPGETVKLSVFELSKQLSTSELQIEVCLGALEAAGLIDSRNLYNISSDTFSFVSGFRFYFHPLGRAFIEACRPPMPKENA